MALVKNSVMAGYSGRIGNLVFRVIKGKTYASIRPQKYRASKSAAAKRARKNFSASVNLAKSVNAVPTLKKIWNSSELEGYSSYHKLISNNSHIIKDGFLTARNIITPEGSYLELSSLTVKNNIFSADFIFPKSANIIFPVELYCFFYFKEYNNTVLSISKKIDEPREDDVYSVSIPLNVLIKTGFSKDPHPMVYLAAAGSVLPREKIYWSSTAAGEI